MEKCKVCGIKLTPEMKFCPECGTKQTQAVSSECFTPATNINLENHSAEEVTEDAFEECFDRIDNALLENNLAEARKLLEKAFKKWHGNKILYYKHAILLLKLGVLKKTTIVLKLLWN